MASEKAKELAAKQKVEAKAAKLRKKNSTNPRDWSQWRQIRETYRITAKEDPKLPLILGAAFFVPLIIGVVLGLVVQPLWFYLSMSLSLGLLLAMLLFVNRAKKATFKRYEGKAGSAEVALSMLGKAWTSSPGINATRQMDVIHRTVGPAGIVLVGEGESGRLKQLISSEVKRHEQVVYGVPVTTIQMGKNPGQVPLDHLTNHIKKLPKAINSTQILDTNKRLKAMDNMRARLSMPKGPMPTSKGARKAMRGR